MELPTHFPLCLEGVLSRQVLRTLNLVILNGLHFSPKIWSLVLNHRVKPPSWWASCSNWQCRAVMQLPQAAPSQALRTATLAFSAAAASSKGSSRKRRGQNVMCLWWGTLSWEFLCNIISCRYSPHASMVSIPFYRCAHWDPEKVINDAYVRRASPAARRICN